MGLRFKLYALAGVFLGTAWISANAPPGTDPKSDDRTPFTSPSDFVLPPESHLVPSDYRESWSRLTGFEFSGLHWNHFVVVYVNKGAEIYHDNYVEYVNAFLEDDWAADDTEKIAQFSGYEVGTVFLKEHFTSIDGKPSAANFLTLMEKMPEGYDSEYGDWRYVWIDGMNGTVIQEGNSQNQTLYSNCIECHSNMRERDYVFATASRAGN